MNYRDKLYSNYVSTHTSRLNGSVGIDGIKRQLPSWEKYYAKFLLPNKDAEILDIGCGNGGFVYFLQTLDYQKAQGIDISREQVELAREMKIKNVIQADFKEFLSDKSEVYDVMFLRDVIEHFAKEEILKILETSYRSLKAGGLLIIQTPNGESFSGSLKYGDFTHETVFTKSSLNQVLMASGFRDVEFHSMGPVPKGLRSAARFILWKCIESAFRLYRAVETGSFKGIFTQNIIAAGKK